MYLKNSDKAILRELKKSDAKSGLDLVRRTGVSPVSVYTNIKVMLKEGIVTATKENRSNIIHLTEYGNKIADALVNMDKVVEDGYRTGEHA